MATIAQERPPPPRDLTAAAEWYISRPVAFVEDFLGATPDPWQAECLEALAAGENVSVRSGHGVGKTSVESFALLWWLATRPGAVVPCTAPTEHQLHDILWAEISRWLSRSPLRDVLEWTATRVTMRGREADWFAVARTSNRPENMAGFHAGHLLYIVDEGSGVADSVMQVVDGARTTEGALVLMCGNPTKGTGHFIESFTKNRWAWHTIHVDSEQSPRVSPQWVEGMARKWGRESDVFRVRVTGEPPRAEADTFISLDVAEAAAARSEAEVPAEGRALCLGVDVGRYGDSESVVVTRRGGRVLRMDAYTKRATTEVAGLVLQAARRAMDEQAHPEVRIKVDDSGVGGGVTDALNEAARGDPRLTVVPCNFGGPGDAHYANATGVMWGALRDLMRAGELALPRDDDLLGQLSSRKYVVDSKGRVVLERKEDMRRRELPSPDRADALALAFYEPGAVPMDDATKALTIGASFYGN